ncbi:MAG TPA: histidine phosphatase family protein [Pseudonocardiaceae bacterium]
MEIVVLRHAECLGNVDQGAYTRIPDHALPLTPRGSAAAAALGPAVRARLGAGPVACYVSPYLRARRTLELLALSDLLERVVPEPRLREQDWGNLQDPAGQALARHERDQFGHFFYRFERGESGADVDDRVAAFVAELEHRVVTEPAHPRTVLLVTHGLTMRLLARRLFGWSVELFESLSNPEPGEHRVLRRAGGRWWLDRPFAQWRDSPDGTTQASALL